MTPDAGPRGANPVWIAALASRLPAPGWRTRFAPAPTGWLHLGHLVNALHVWGIARAYGGQVALRIEDHDRGRCRPEYEQGLLDDLEWLGLVPDVYDTSSFRADASTHGARQSNQGARYAAALDVLRARGGVFACRCSRREIARQGARAGRAMGGDGQEQWYPGTCRNAAVAFADTLARRVHLDDVAVVFDDLRLGVRTQYPAQQCGDLLLRDRAGHWTYQFAVVVDDMTHDIDVIVRGEDLLTSTGRQWQLAALLGRTTMPQVLHHTLLVHADGSKLSKARHDTGLRDLRAAGATAEQLLGEAAARAGLITEGRPLPVDAIAELFAR
jgi:glutamyl-tRNA synthetase/glutamyl-Q tRNA(Asp) synthetase